MIWSRGPTRFAATWAAMRSHSCRRPLPTGSVFVVVDGDRLAVATTGADPTVGLVFYDLKTLLRQLATTEAEPQPEPAPAAEPSAGETSAEENGDA